MGWKRLEEAGYKKGNLTILEDRKNRLIFNKVKREAIENKNNLIILIGLYYSGFTGFLA